MYSYILCVNLHIYHYEILDMLCIANLLLQLIQKQPEMEL